MDSGLYMGIKESLRYLFALGCRNVIYIDRFSPNGHFSDGNDMRYRGFTQEMKELGLSSFPEQNIITGCRSRDEIALRLENHHGNPKARHGKGDH